MLNIMLVGGCALLDIRYPNGINSGVWYQEQPKNMQEEDSVLLAKLST